MDSFKTMHSTTSTTDTTHLLTRIARRDNAVWHAFIERFGRHIYGIAWRILGDRQLAEDASQETLVRINAYAARFNPGDDPDASARAWIARIACTCALKLRRRRRSAEIHLPHDLSSPMPAQVDSDLMARLRASLEDMPATYREAFVLHHIAELPHADIARQLACSEASARVRAHRGFVWLQQRLGGVSLAAVLARLSIGSSEVEPALTAMHGLTASGLKGSIASAVLVAAAPIALKVAAGTATVLITFAGIGLLLRPSPSQAAEGMRPTTAVQGQAKADADALHARGADAYQRALKAKGDERDQLLHDALRDLTQAMVIYNRLLAEKPADREKLEQKALSCNKLRYGAIKLSKM
jgi:RNA polymerase sigma-70 factor, ECF subfamily